jgi:hypothetical protein
MRTTTGSPLPVAGGPLFLWNHGFLFHDSLMSRLRPSGKMKAPAPGLTSTITIFVDRPLSSFCRTEKSVVPSSAGTTTSPSMIADPALMCQASDAIFRKRLVQSLPRRVKFF